MPPAADPRQPAIGCLALAIPSAPETPSEDGRRILPVLPAPVDGRITTLDGRRFTLPEGGIPALVEALNRQPLAVRIDRDHHTEPSSPTWRGHTEALGWAGPFHAADGGIATTATLAPEARALLEEGRYRYLSPSLQIDESARILGLSSIALTNRPALGASAQLTQEDPAMSESPPTSSVDLARREADLAAREERLRNACLALANAEIDQAVTAGTVAAAEREALLSQVRDHRDGADAGLAAMRSAIAARAPAGAAKESDQALLTGRVVPGGPPPGKAGEGVPLPRVIADEARALMAEDRTGALTADLAVRRVLDKRGLSAGVAP